MPQMCSTLSTSAWIGLLVRIVEGQQAFNAVSLQRQVREEGGEGGREGGEGREGKEFRWRMWKLDSPPLFLLQILALRLLQAVLPSWDKTERCQDMKFLVEKLFCFLGSLLSTCSSDLPLLRGTCTAPPGGPALALQL